MLEGEEKDSAVQLQCTLFNGDYTTLIGALPRKDIEFGVLYQSFIVVFLITHVVVVITVVSK